MQDPKKPKSNADRLEEMLQGARDSGAVQGTAEDLENPGRGGGGGGARGGGRAFQGTGRTLGSTADGGGDDSAAAAAPAAPAAPAPVTHVITFWTNGFTVDDGPLRAYDDPANTAFMQSVGKGQCPRELEPENRMTPMNINLVKKEEDYVPPPEPKYKAFSGAGRTLGGSDGASGSGSSAPTPSAAAAVAAPSAGDWSIDESAPTTSIQLRLRDGSRLVAKFNLTHTVADIRAFIARAAPGCASGNYSLQLAGFPPKQLTDQAQLISDGLSNSVVIQR